MHLLIGTKVSLTTNGLDLGEVKETQFRQVPSRFWLELQGIYSDLLSDFTFLLTMED